MLTDLGCSYVVVGHSERREHHHEGDTLINAKVAAALRHQLTPILCVGEGLDQRNANQHVTHCRHQLDAALADLAAQQVARVVIAYEPVWAIGTGQVATADDAQEVCHALRAQIGDRFGIEAADAIRILYGGSVKASNVTQLTEQPAVDGALVGGASLDVHEFATVPVVDGGVQLGDLTVPVEREVLARADAVDVTLGVRPEDLVIAEHGMPVRVDVVEELGADAYLYGTTATTGNEHPLIARVDGRRPPQSGQTVYLAPRAAHTHVFSRRDGLRLTA